MLGYTSQGQEWAVDFRPQCRNPISLPLGDHKTILGYKLAKRAGLSRYACFIYAYAKSWSYENERLLMDEK